MSNIAHENKIEFEKYFTNFIETYYFSNNTLNQAIKYTLYSKAKRVRPMLMILAFEAIQKSVSKLDLKVLLSSATALEFLHSYSLVHDDLPCMDDDDLRRGQPTTHIKYDEATAILVGDALLTDSFNIISNLENTSSDVIVQLIQELSAATGSKGMVLGQAEDIYWTNKDNATLDNVMKVHLNKTGMLLGCAFAFAATLSKCTIELVTELKEIGQDLGLVFQLMDDYLDDSTELGKSSSKDRKANKLTILKFNSKKATKQIIDNKTLHITSKLQAIALQHDYNFNYLIEYINYLKQRKY